MSTNSKKEMKKTMFIAQFVELNPEASEDEAIKAWYKANTTRASHSRQHTKNKVGTILHFCQQHGISRAWFYANKKKFEPLYLEYFNNCQQNYIND